MICQRPVHARRKRDTGAPGLGEIIRRNRSVYFVLYSISCIIRIILYCVFANPSFTAHEALVGHVLVGYTIAYSSRGFGFPASYFSPTLISYVIKVFPNSFPPFE